MLVRITFRFIIRGLHYIEGFQYHLNYSNIQHPKTMCTNIPCCETVVPFVDYKIKCKSCTLMLKTIMIITIIPSSTTIPQTMLNNSNGNINNIYCYDVMMAMTIISNSSTGSKADAPTRPKTECDNVVNNNDGLHY